MKSFALCVILATLMCFFLSTHETEGQLSFMPQRPNQKTGRSLDKVSTEPFLHELNFRMISLLVFLGFGHVDIKSKEIQRIGKKV